MKEVNLTLIENTFEQNKTHTRRNKLKPKTPGQL